jgi:hypothetical protein
MKNALAATSASTANSVAMEKDIPKKRGNWKDPKRIVLPTSRFDAENQKRNRWAVAPLTHHVINLSLVIGDPTDQVRLLLLRNLPAIILFSKTSTSS